MFNFLKGACALLIAVLLVCGIVLAIGEIMDRQHDRQADSKTRTTVSLNTATGPYVASAFRTQLYRSGTRGDAMLFRVVDLPNENLRCIFVVGDGRFGRAATCQALNALEGR